MYVWCNKMTRKQNISIAKNCVYSTEFHTETAMRIKKNCCQLWKDRLKQKLYE